jgi:hypothetical protein
MTLYWLRPAAGGRTTSQLVEELHPFGIRLRKPLNRGCVVYRDQDEDVLVKEVGDLAWWPDGQINVFPRRDATDREVQLLLRCAQKAFRDGKPSRATGWIDRRRKKQGSWWRSTIMRLVYDDDAESGAFVAAEPIQHALPDQLDVQTAPPQATLS